VMMLHLTASKHVPSTQRVHEISCSSVLERVLFSEKHVINENLQKHLNALQYTRDPGGGVGSDLRGGDG